jgi:hypothetical protein
MCINYYTKQKTEETKGKLQLSSYPYVTQDSTKKRKIVLKIASNSYATTYER